MRVAALALIALVFALAAIHPSAASLSNEYASSVAKLVLEWIKPFACTNSPLLRALERAEAAGSMSALYGAISMDSDCDGVPDVFEYIDGLSPYLPTSFGYRDLEYFVGRIVVDGWPGDWVVNGKCVRELRFEVSGALFAPVKSVYAAKQGDYVAISIVFGKGFVYGNTSVARFRLYMEVDGRVVSPARASQWGLALEALFSYRKVFSLLTKPRASLVLVITAGHRVVEKVVAELNPLELPSLGPLCWRGFVEPLWSRERVVEPSLPVYFLVVYGDNRQPSWGEVMYSSEAYKAFSEFRAINPVALVGTGDHVVSGTRRQIEEFLRATAGIANNWVVAGNHDWSYTRYADREFWLRYVVPNLYYRDVGDWRIVFVNGYALDQAMLKKLELLMNSSCLAGKRVVLVWHDPITYSVYNYPTDFSRWQMKELRSLVARYRGCVKLMLFGHLHVFKEGRYLGIPYVITGGAGAPLSSPKYGLPVYHYVALELFANGSIRIVPIAIDGGSISVERVVTEPGIILFRVVNEKKDVWGRPVAVPMRVETFVKGLHLEVFLVAPPGTTVVRIECRGSEIVVSSNASTWFAYAWGLGVLRPSKNFVRIDLPTGSKPSISVALERGLIVVRGCSKCTAYALVNASGYELSLALAPSGRALVADPSYVANASAYGVSFGSNVEVVASNGLYTEVKRVELPLSPPNVSIKYLPQCVGKELEFELCSSGRASVEILIDGVLAKELSVEGCTRVKLSVAKYGEGTHVLTVVYWSGESVRASKSLGFSIVLRPPEIVSSESILAPSIGSSVGFEVRGVPPLTVIIKCVNTSVSKVVNCEGRVCEVSIKPIDLGIVSSGRYVLSIVVYDEAGHEVEKSVSLLVGSPTSTTRTPATSATRLSSSTTTSSATKLTTVSSGSTATLVSSSAKPQASARPRGFLATAIASAVIIAIALGMAIALYSRRKR